MGGRGQKGTVTGKVLADTKKDLQLMKRVISAEGVADTKKDLQLMKRVISAEGVECDFNGEGD